MEKFMHYEFLNNTMAAYLYVVGTIVLLLFIKRLISRFIASKLLGAIAGDKKSRKKERFLDLVVKPIERFLLVSITITALDKLDYPTLLHFKIAHLDAEVIIRSLAMIIMIIVFIRLCIRIMEFIALVVEEKHGQTKADNQLIVFFRDFFKVILIVIGGLLIVRFVFDKDITTILTGLSIVGAALALAAKESLENLIASFIIFFDKPFVAGETVKVLNTTGTVEKIGLRSTRIRTDQKTFITVPNKQMVDTVIDNISLRSQRKVELRLELSLSVTATQLRQLTASLKVILQDKAPVESYSVYLMDTGRNAHLMAIDYFTTMKQSMDAFNAFREEINLEVIDLLSTDGISLAASSTSITITRD